MADGTLFIADTNNNRILKSQSALHPPDGRDLRPVDGVSAVCDNDGRVFCLAQNINRGLSEADTVTGFIGASEVKYT